VSAERAPRVQIAPSVISADFLNLGASVGAIERAGADMLHFDVMDGQFVPNITMGPLLLQALKRQVKIPIDVHLMIADPDRYLGDFAKAGADILIVHQEAVTHLHRTIAHIHSLGCKAGVALNPATPIALLEDILEELDTVLVMSVNPGFGGQTFIPRSESKIAALRALIARRGARARIEVDGGVDPDTIGRVVTAGAEILVAGAAVFGQPDPVAALHRLREAAAVAPAQAPAARADAS
jgi:ribulose-phosphate 3-epimerase